MRITAGLYRSRVLKTLSGNNTRPTLDKVKEAIFSRIGPYFEYGTMLDLFSGSGAISLEAISRGFDKAIMVDNNKDAIKIIKDNISSLRVEHQCEVWPISYKSALEKCSLNHLKFNLIYLDPPYAKMLISELVRQIKEKDLLEDGGVIVAESSLEEEIHIDLPYYIDKQSTYGSIRVTYVKKGVNL